jgi:hypothetical protein
MARGLLQDRRYSDLFVMNSLLLQSEAHISNYLVPYRHVPGWRSWPFTVGRGIHAGPIYFTEGQFPEMMSPS